MSDDEPVDLARVALRAALGRLAERHPHLVTDEPVSAEDWRGLLEETMAETRHTAFRLPADLVDEVDAYAEQVQEAVAAALPPGVEPPRFSRTEAVVALLRAGLAAERERRGE